MADLLNTHLGQYRLTEVIRRGGMATVYKAYQESLDRYVAVKVLFHSQDPQFAMRFKREARAIAHLQHPNILPIYDNGEQDGLLYLVLQYIEGGMTLGDMLGKPMAPVPALRLVARVLSALDYAHQRGIVHRDIKPGNILMPSPTWPMLADFGIAKLLTEGDSQSLNLTSPSLIIGTPAYLAPEQALGQPIDGRTDLYSTGVVLYQMVTGHVPFDSGTPVVVLTKQAYEAPPPPTMFNPDLPPTVAVAVMRALEKDPAHRYQNAAEMAEALEQIAADLEPARTATPPVESRPAAGAPSDLHSHYVAGVQAFSAQRWDQAVQSLRQVVAVDPTYENATRLLEAALAALRTPGVATVVRSPPISAAPSESPAPGPAAPDSAPAPAPESTATPRTRTRRPPTPAGGSAPLAAAPAGESAPPVATPLAAAESGADAAPAPARRPRRRAAGATPAAGVDTPAAGTAPPAPRAPEVATNPAPAGMQDRARQAGPPAESAVAAALPAQPGAVAGTVDVQPAPARRSVWPFVATGAGLLLLALAVLFGPGLFASRTGTTGTGGSPTPAPATTVATPNAAATLSAVPVAVPPTLAQATAVATAAVPTATPVAATAAPTTAALVATTDQGAVGAVRFADDKQAVDQLVITATLSTLPARPVGKALFAWMVDSASGTSLNLGRVVPDDNGLWSFTYNDPEQANLSGRFDGFLMTYEPLETTPSTPSTEIVVRGQLPPEALVHIRHLLFSYPDTPQQVGLEVGLRAQVAALAQHAGLLDAAQKAGSLAKVKLEAEQIANLIEGNQGPDFGDLNKDGKVDNAGDGFGLLVGGPQPGYIQDAKDHAELSATAPDATENVKQHAATVMVTAENVQERVTTIRDQALAMLKTPTIAEVRPLVATTVKLAGEALNGVPGADGKVLPVAGSGGALTGYNEALLMATMPIQVVK